MPRLEYDGTNIQNKNELDKKLTKKLTISGESLGENSVYHYLTTTTLRTGRSVSSVRVTKAWRFFA